MALVFTRTLRSVALLAGVAWALTSPQQPASGQVKPRSLPEGAGLAAKYRGDAGIEKDRDVVFLEDFEEASLGEMQKRWEGVSGAEIMSLSGDVPPGSAGKRSLLMTHVGGRGDGGHLYRRLLPG